MLKIVLNFKACVLILLVVCFKMKIVGYWRKTMQIFVNKSITLADGEIFNGKGKIFSGEKVLNNFSVGDKVYSCDLNTLNVIPYKMRSRGFSREHGGGHSELFQNDKPFNISRYPKAGKFLTITDYLGEFNSIDGLPAGELKQGFFYNDDRPKDWKESQDIWMHGYWAYDWANSYEQIEKFDKEKGYIVAKEPYGIFYYRKGQRFHFLNVLEEVTEKGDYCIDYKNNLLNFIPYNKNCKNITLSVAEYPCFSIVNKNNVVVKNCTIKGFTGNGIYIENCNGITFKNCKIYNVGGCGAVVKNSYNVVFENCEIYHVGDSGIEIDGGDRQTLKSSNSVIKNCKIHDISVWCRTYAPAINAFGVGISIYGNEIYNCPHSGIIYGGNNIKIYQNCIYNVLYETGDAGAIYAGRNYSYRGNEVHSNLLCLTGGKYTMGVYNDDCLSGTNIYNNVFYKVSRAVFLGGGVDFKVKNNLFVSLEPAINIDSRGASTTVQWRENMKNLKTYLSEVEGAKDLYLSAYPEMQKIYNYFSEQDLPFIYSDGEITDNVFCNCTEVNLENFMTEEHFNKNYVYARNVSVKTDHKVKKFVDKNKYKMLLKAFKIERKLRNERNK